MKKAITKIQAIHKGEITLNDVRDKIIVVQNKNVLLNSDVAWLYGVDTNDVNQAVKRNPDKFPEGYIINLTRGEWAEMKSKFSASLTAGGKEEVATICGNPKIKFSPTPPKAFTEKGLYMLATILKSGRATDTTLAIVEAFAKMRELTHTIADLVKSPGDAQKQADVMRKSGELLSDMVTKELQTTGTETSFEINLFSAVKIKHTIKKGMK